MKDYEVLSKKLSGKAKSNMSTDTEKTNKNHSETNRATFSENNSFNNSELIKELRDQIKELKEDKEKILSEKDQLVHQVGKWE